MNTANPPVVYRGGSRGTIKKARVVDMAKILLIEDDLFLQENLANALISKDYLVEAVSDAPEASFRAKTYHYDLLIVDWELPGGCGLGIVRQVRSQSKSCAILMLTGKGSTVDKETGLDAGADDYLAKPFDVNELQARVRALLRRSRYEYVPKVEKRGISLDKDKGTVERNGKSVHLTPKEFAILELLMSHPGQPFTAEAMCDRIWQSDRSISSESIRTYINRLRASINEGTDDPIIKTVWGRGYKFDA